MASSVDKDLIKILKNHSMKADARLQGWEYVLSLTGSEEGVRRMVSCKEYATFLLTYLKDPSAEPETLHLAHKCLVNLTSAAQGSSFLLSEDQDFVIALLRDICDASSDFVESKVYILSNLSHNTAAEECGILSVFPDLWKKHLKSCFWSSEREVRDRYQFLALVFSNISKTSEGRKLLTEDESFLSTFLLGLNPAEPETRRLGMALTIRNCCSDTSCHQRVLEDLPSLLLPLMGPEEFDEETTEKLPVECQYLEETKQREELPQIRKALVQALSLLCYTEEGWNSLKNQGVYSVIRELHLWEKDADVCEAIETLVGFLLVDKYTASPSSQQLDGSSIVPAETDLLRDIADVVIR